MSENVAKEIGLCGEEKKNWGKKPAETTGE